MTTPVLLYDTTLRDGTQREGLALSLADKLRIARRLDAAGFPYVEGGWPGSNPKDSEFFAPRPEQCHPQARQTRGLRQHQEGRDHSKESETKASESCSSQPRHRSSPSSARVGTSTCARRSAPPSKRTWK